MRASVVGGTGIGIRLRDNDGDGGTGEPYSAVWAGHGGEKKEEKIIVINWPARRADPQRNA